MEASLSGRSLGSTYNRKKDIMKAKCMRDMCMRSLPALLYFFFLCLDLLSRVGLISSSVLIYCLFFFFPWSFFILRLFSLHHLGYYSFSNTLFCSALLCFPAWCILLRAASFHLLLSLSLFFVLFAVMFARQAVCASAWRRREGGGARLVCVIWQHCGTFSRYCRLPLHCFVLRQLGSAPSY